MTQTRESLVFCGGLQAECRREGECGTCLKENTPESNRALIGFVRAAGEDPSGRTFVDRDESYGNRAVIYKYIGMEDGEGKHTTDRERQIVVEQGRIVSDQTSQRNKEPQNKQPSQA